MDGTAIHEGTCETPEIMTKLGIYAKSRTSAESISHREATIDGTMKVIAMG